MYEDFKVYPPCRTSLIRQEYMRGATGVECVCVTPSRYGSGKVKVDVEAIVEMLDELLSEPIGQVAVRRWNPAYELARIHTLNENQAA